MHGVPLRIEYGSVASSAFRFCQQPLEQVRSVAQDGVADGLLPSLHIEVALIACFVQRRHQSLDLFLALVFE